MEERSSHFLFLRLCSWLSRLTQFAGLLTSAMNVCMVFMFSAMPTPELILRCYGVIFGVLIVLVELELPVVLSHAAFMSSWVGRGLCIAFVGLLDVLFDHKKPTNSSSSSSSSSVAGAGGAGSMGMGGSGALDGGGFGTLPGAGHHQEGEERFIVVRHAVGWLVIGVGCVYTALGLLCFRQLRAVALSKLRRQKILKEEVNHLTAQKMEIERLLSDTESKLEVL